MYVIKGKYNDKLYPVDALYGTWDADIYTTIEAVEAAKETAWRNGASKIFDEIVVFKLVEVNS